MGPSITLPSTEPSLQMGSDAHTPSAPELPIPAPPPELPIPAPPPGGPLPIVPLGMVPNMVPVVHWNIPQVGLGGAVGYQWPVLNPALQMAPSNVYRTVP